VSQPPRIAVATHPGKPEITEDDRPAFDLVEAHGIAVEAIPWSREGADWGGFDAVLIRSTWDYHRHPAAFREWAEEVEESGARLWNPADVVAWNSEKTYLRDLEKAGIPIVPTRWVAATASAPSLASLLREKSWPEVVVKPTVSASAYRTMRMKTGQAAEHQQDFAALLADSGAMIQPLMEEIVTEGEWSLLYFRQEGRLHFSHAVLKTPKAGDFRVQSELGGQSLEKDPPYALREQVDELVAKASRVAPDELLYARVDGVVSRGEHAPAGTFLLMELELIEPFIFLEAAAGAAENFAAAIVAAVE
jgi:glutathione synthase/RimK-type ligase-like ATP-grasp enzyme